MRRTHVVGQEQQVAVELELTSMKGVAEPLDELAAEDTAEYARYRPWSKCRVRGGSSGSRNDLVAAVRAGCLPDGRKRRSCR